MAEGRVFPEKGERGKVCQNRGGITGSREKRTRRRLRDIDFIALSTNFARIGFFHAKKSHGVVFQVRFSKKNHGHPRWKSKEAFNESRTAPRSRSFAQKHGRRSSIRFRIIFTMSLVDVFRRFNLRNLLAERRVRNDGDRRAGREFAILENNREGGK